LWSNVLLLALQDGSSPLGSRSCSRSRSRSRQPALVIQARAWLTTPSADLHLVLSFCDLDPDAWHSRTTPQLRRQWQEIDASGARRRAIRAVVTRPRRSAGPKRRFREPVAESARPAAS
jgi:hypothetical protein